MLTTHHNDLKGIIVWSGDIAGDAAIISSTRKSAKLWVFKKLPNNTTYWKVSQEYKNKEEAFKDLGIPNE